MSFELQRVVRDSATARLGLVIARLPNEVYVVRFDGGVQERHLRELREGDTWDVMDWREAQGLGGGTLTDRETGELLVRP